MAVPNPERERKRLQRSLQGALPSCLIIQGAAEFFRQEAMDEVAAALPAELDLRTIDGDQKTDGQELEGLCGGALFGGGSVLFVRRGDAWYKEQGERLLQTLPRMAAGSCLVLEVKKLDKRTRIYKALSKQAETFEFRELYAEPYDRSRSPLEAELVAWIVSRAKEGGCPLTAEAAFLLMSTVGTNPGEILAELQRIQVELGKSRKARGPEELRGSLTCSFESTPFEFAEAVLARDRKRATRALTALYRRGTKGRDGARVDTAGLFPFLSSWLFRQLTQAYEGRRLMDQGVPLSDVPGRVGVRGFVDRYTAGLRRNETAQLQRGIELLHDCQRRLRSSGEDPEWLLLQFLAGYFAGEQAA